MSKLSLQCYEMQFRQSGMFPTNKKKTGNVKLETLLMEIIKVPKYDDKKKKTISNWLSNKVIY